MATTLQVEAVHEISPARQLSPGWTPAGKAFALALGLRIFYSLLAAAFSPYLRLDPNLIHSNQLTGNLISRVSHPVLYALLGVWERFDTLWYLQITRHGYGSPMATVFYPLYPALIRAISFNARFDLVAALLISTVASFFLFWGALRLFELDDSPAVSFRALLLWVAWPASFAFFAGYPDSLLCAFTVWSLYFARSGRWFPAGTMGLLAGCTKALGCLALLPLLWIAWKQRNRGGVFAAALCGAGMACFQGWLLINRFPSAAEVYKTYWATSTVAPWTSLIDAVRSLAQGGDLLLILNAAVLGIAGTAALMRSVRFEYKVYAIAAMCLFLTKHTDPLLQSTTRYSLAVFAAYPALSTRLGEGLRFGAAIVVALGINLFLFRIFLDWGLVV